MGEVPQSVECAVEVVFIDVAHHIQRLRPNLLVDAEDNHEETEEGFISIQADD